MGSEHNITNKGDESNRRNLVRMLYTHSKCVLSLEELNERMLNERVQFDAQLNEITIILRTYRKV